MPTFAHVAAALMYAALAWFVSQTMIEPLFPDGFNPGWFSEINAAVGLVCGWKIMGSRATLGFTTSVSVGFTTSIIMVFWALFLHSFGDMIRRSLDREYEGPTEAIIAVFELGIEHFMLMATAPIWTVLIVGGIIAGIIAGIFGRIWR